jgi:hypothetical protein
MPRYREPGQSWGDFLNSLRAFMRTFQSAFFLKPIVFSLAEVTSLSNLALSQKEFLRKKRGTKDG